MLTVLLLATALAGPSEPVVVDDPVEVRAVEQVLRPVNTVAGRTELGGGFARVGSTFLRRSAVSAHVAHHPSESFAVRLTGTFLPDLGQADWRPLHHTMLQVNRMYPDVTKVLVAGDLIAEFAPVQGVITSGRRVWDVDAVLLGGAGLAWTQDDLEAIQCSGLGGDPCVETAGQLPATVTLGGGLRLHRKRAMLRLEVRSSWFANSYDGVQVDIERRTWLGLRAGALLGS